MSAGEGACCVAADEAAGFLAVAGFFWALTATGINTSAKATMYVRCTVDLKLNRMVPNRANIVPITYGTDHARGASHRPDCGGTGYSWGRLVSTAQLHAPRPFSSVRP